MNFSVIMELKSASNGVRSFFLRQPFLCPERVYFVLAILVKILFL